MTDIERDQYDNLAAIYDAIEELPQSILYQQQVASALGDCTGKTVLDLGGGTGLHARKAIELGAKLADVVDISPEMLKMGEATETKLNRKGRIRWHVGDMSEDLKDLPLEKEGYDIVMVNWTFDHAETDSMLEDMWGTTSSYTKSGGKLISIRMADPKAKAAEGGKYGASFANIKEIPGGLQYTYTAHIDPPLTCPATTMSASMSLEKAKEMAERFGFVDFQKVDVEGMEVVKKDPEFWKVYLEDPHFICIEARKK